MVGVRAKDLSAGAGSRLPRAVTACAAVAVVALFYAAKVGLFKGLHYTFDLFSFVQMSRGWLRGHALLHENGYGNHGQVHNYYTILVFGPLSQLWGAYGLFLGHMLLLLGAAVALIRAAPVGSPAAAADIGSVFAMFARACVVLAPRRLHLRMARRAPVLGLFALGMLFLRWKNYPVPHMWGQERVRSAFENLSLLRNVPHQAAALAQLRGGLLLPPALFGAALAVRSRIGWRQVGLALALWVFAMAPLVIVGSVESLAYASLPPQFVWHGLSWPPRFVSLWTAAAVALFQLARLPAAGSRLRNLGLPVLGAAGAIAAMMTTLHIVRDYEPLYRIGQAGNWRAEGASRYAGVDIDAIWCLARRLPEDTKIAVPRWLYGAFHRQEIVFLERTSPGGQRPDLTFERDPSAPKGFRLVGEAPPGPDDWRACLR